MADSRDWRQARRARTRLLIEYGGLIVKAGLDSLLEDDRATLFGGLLTLCDRLAGLDGDPPDTVKLRWRRRGLRAFDADASATEKLGKREEGKPGAHD